MFEKELNSLFETMISKNFSQGIQWSIQKDNLTYNGKVGFMNCDQKVPIRHDTIYRIWSMTPIINWAIKIIIIAEELPLVPYRVVDAVGDITVCVDSENGQAV